MPHTTPTQAAAVLTESAETINGEAPNALNILAALIDIYDDAQSAAPEDRCYVPGAWPDVLDMARKLLAAPTPALLGASVGEPIFDAVCDALHIGSAARSLSTVMMNLSNLKRRAECLSAIERMFFTVTEEGDEEDDFEPRDVCLLNWGHDPDDYVKAFGEALATRASSSAQAVERVPLTVARIEELWGDFMSARGSGYVPDFVRAIEREHGIDAQIAQAKGGDSHG